MQYSWEKLREILAVLVQLEYKSMIKNIYDLILWVVLILCITVILCFSCNNLREETSYSNKIELKKLELKILEQKEK